MEMESSRPGPAADLDRISGLPDELLVTILAGLRSAAAAARTSVLSHRWRRVWTKIPDLIFLDDSTPDTVDAAIAAYTAPVMGRFAVGLEDLSRPVDAARAAVWLRFVASRAPREVHVLLPCKEPPPLPEEEEVEEELEVPVLESTLWLDASFVYDFRLRLPAAGAGSFAELRILSISFGRVSGADLSRVVTAQCPCLRVLELALLDVDGDVSIRSDTLGRLALRAVGHENRLDVVAPNLEWLQVHGCNYVDARISAPILTEVEWDDGYDPARHRFIDTGRRLHRLAVTQWTQMPPLLERFDVADELSLHLTIPPKMKPLRTIIRSQPSRTPLGDITNSNDVLLDSGQERKKRTKAGASYHRRKCIKEDSALPNQETVVPDDLFLAATFKKEMTRLVQSNNMAVLNSAVRRYAAIRDAGRCVAIRGHGGDG